MSGRYATASSGQYFGWNLITVSTTAGMFLNHKTAGVNALIYDGHVEWCVMDLDGDGTITEAEASTCVTNADFLNCGNCPNYRLCNP